MNGDACTCDMFPDTHPAGQVDGLAECETTLRPTGPMISPHMFPAARTANDPWRRHDPVE